METQLAPGFLIASPSLKDPFFEKTVIFLLEHDNDEGTFGIVMNKVANIELQDVLKELNINVDMQYKETPFPEVIEGGPVTPEFGWLVHSLDWQSEKTKIVNNEIGVTASLEILEDITKGKGPNKYFFCLGYSGWSEGQLLQELQIGSWLHLPFDASLFFDVPPDDLWSAAIKKLGIDPAYLSPSIGGA